MIDGDLGEFPIDQIYGNEVGLGLGEDGELIRICDIARLILVIGLTRPYSFQE